MPESCQECKRLLEAYISALREKNVVLCTVSEAKEAGVLDELGVMVAEAQIESARSHLCHLQRAYARHREELHS